MENNSSIMVKGSFQNPITLNDSNDILIIKTPRGEVRFTLDKIMDYALVYGDLYHTRLAIEGNSLIINNKFI